MLCVTHLQKNHGGRKSQERCTSIWSPAVVDVMEMNERNDVQRVSLQMGIYFLIRLLRCGADRRSDR